MSLLGKIFLSPHPPSDITHEACYGALFQFFEKEGKIHKCDVRDIIQGAIHEKDADGSSPMTHNGLHAPNTTTKRTHTSSPLSQRPAPHHHTVMKADTDGVLKPLRHLALYTEPASDCHRGAREFLGGESVSKTLSRSEMQLLVRCHLQPANNPNKRCGTV